MNKMTWEHTDGMPHIVIIRGQGIFRMVEFEGKEARDKAHRYAEDAALSEKVFSTVAVRVRQCGDFRTAKDLELI